jgi:trans-aconitate 2-methyltransferase
MLDRARDTLPAATFIQADIADWTPAVPPDILYSNAALHWLPDHAILLPRLLGLLAPGGVLAIQMPMMHDAPFRTLIPQVAAAGPWASQLAAVAPVPAILEPHHYWDLLRPRTTTLDLWETTYHHALTGPDAVMQWASGTSLRPFLDALPDPEMKKAFRAAYADAVRPCYPSRADGTTLLPFHRLFMVAQA